MNKQLYFPKRMPEPKEMGALESKVFESLSRQNYRRWILPLVDDCLKNFGKKSGRILDVGSGPGFLVKELAKRSKKFEVTGIDISRYANKLAEKNCKGLKNVRFVAGSVGRLPFAAGSFDLVLTKDSLHHFPKLVPALKEMLRVLAPGGLLYIQDLKRDVPLFLLKRATPPVSVMQKLQYYSARAAYTKPELSVALKKATKLNFKINTRKITPDVKKRYSKAGIDLNQLKESFISRYVCILKK